MKGGADLEDQLAISRAVADAAANNDGVLDVVRLASTLNIPLECCQSFVDHFSEKQGVKLGVPGEVATGAKKSGKKKVQEESPGDSFFG